MRDVYKLDIYFSHKYTFQKVIDKFSISEHSLGIETSLTPTPNNTRKISQPQRLCNFNS